MSQRRIVVPNGGGHVPNETEIKLALIGTMSNVAMLFGQSAQAFARLAILDTQRANEILKGKRNDAVSDTDDDNEASNADLEYDLLEETAWYYKEAAEMAADVLLEQRRKYGMVNEEVPLKQ
ncbi:MAG: hypothetical protein PHN44_04050 [Candidatus Marinimicrobia bacterium]|nr:hypothetical protein [Candidatus Neomarinimicrobiota bacterium]MDD5540321.1 hypothetical protein [Candidatus Neomarinimicrobiota bacterium]